MAAGKISGSRSSHLAHFGFAALLLGLAACQTSSSDSASPTATQSEAAQSETGLPQNPDTGLGQESGPAPQTSEEAALPEEPPIDDRPGRFLGLAQSALEAELGAPELLRRESPAEVWQYRADDCILDFFLYPEAGELRVVHLESRDRSARDVETSACLRSLIQKRRAASLS